MLSKLTIMGLHNYSGGELWENLRLPEGIDRDSFINEVLRQSAEFSLLYPDYEFMKVQIGIFSNKWYHTFEKWLAMYNAQYEPLYNVDVTTTTTDEIEDNGTEDKHRSGQGTSQGRNQSLDDKSKAAFDASTYQPTERDSLSTSTSLSTSEMASESNSNSWEHSQTTEEYKRGNFGMTMSQELWLAEVNMWYWNMYQHMAEIFVTEYCICVYM